jgi:hypothetical protein
MESAFGIDHGYEDIEKFSFGGGMLRTLGTGIGQSLRRGASQTGKAAGRSIAGGNPATGKAQIKIGQGLKRASNFAMQRPKLAGGLAAGGAAATVGGAGFAAGNNKRY